MRKLFFLFWLLALSAYGQGVSIRSDRGQGTNLAVWSSFRLTNANFHIGQGQTNPVTAPAAVENAVGALSGIYTYQYTWVTAFGESAPSGISLDANPSSQSIDVTGIMTGPAYVTGRKVYRSRTGGSGNLYLVTNIANNVTTAFTDNKTDANLGEPAPLNNRSSGGTFFLNGEPIGYIDSQNVQWGLRAGASNRSSGQSVILGTDAGASLSTGSDGSTIAGAEAGQYVTNGAGNTFYGNRAGRFLKRGQQNSAKGVDSLGELLEGDFNTADGWDSLYAMRYGSNNAAFAKFAGERLWSGIDNLFLGAHAQPSKTTEIYITNRNGMIVIGAWAHGHTNYVGVLGGTSTNGSAITNWYLGGFTNASPGGVVVNASSGLGTDNAGGSLTIAAGRGTGSGTPGKVNVATSAAGASGSTLQTLTTNFTVTSDWVSIGTGGPFILHGDGTENYLSNAVPARQWISYNAVNDNVVIHGNVANRIAAYDGSGGLTAVTTGTNGQALFRTATSYAWSNVVAGGTTLSAPLSSIIYNSNGVFTGDVEFVRTNGNVGIGTNAPDGKLEVFSTNPTAFVLRSPHQNILFKASTNGILETDGSLSLNGGVNAGGNIVSPIFWATDRVRSDGRLDVGTNQGVATTEIFSSDADGALKITSPHTPAALLVGTNGNVGIGTISPLAALHISNSQPVLIRFDTAHTQNALTMTSNGFFGIDVAVPLSKLHVSGGDVRLGNDLAYGWGDMTTFIYGNASSDYIKFRTAATDKVTIDAVGNVGIGTTGPNTTLHVASSGGNQLTLEDTAAGLDLKKWVLNSESGTLRVKLVNDAFNSSQTFATVLSSGSVGIGTASPAQTLHVNGNTYMDGGQSIKVFVTNASFTISTNFYGFVWTAIAVGGTITLPAATTCSNWTGFIKDEGGNAFATNITIAPASGTIDGAASILLNGNFATKSIYSGGSRGWFTR